MPKDNSKLRHNNKLSLRETKQSLSILSVVVSLLHLFFFVFFLYHSYMIMAVYNFVVVFIYIFCYILVIRFDFIVAITIALLEILIQTVLASYCLGNDWGFYLYNFIAIIPAIFQYKQEDLVKPKKFGKISFLIILDMISFYAAYYFHIDHTPVYMTKEGQAAFFYILNSGFSFLVLMIIGYMVMKSAFSIAKTTLMDNKRLNSMASTDPLTGLLNRRSMSAKLEEFYERFEKEGSQFSILMLDVDYFKKINDTYGHAIGDKVLVNMSVLIKAQLRYGDFASRWGGEEFLVVLADAGKGEALSVAERIRLNISETPTVLDNGISIAYHVTIGVATVSSGIDIEDIINEADKKLYHGKKTGRNRVVV